MKRYGVAEWNARDPLSFHPCRVSRSLLRRTAPQPPDRLHRRVGKHLEACQGDRATEAAAELASHFERGDDLLRAVSYYRQAGENALRRHGYQEASTQCRHGLSLLKKLPPGLTRDQHEVGLCLTLGPALVATKGHAALELEQVYLSARTLCHELGEPDLLFPVLWGLMAQYLLRAQLGRARALGEQLLRLAETRHEPALLLEASLGQGSALLWSGQLERGQRHFERAMDLYDAAQHRPHAFVYGQDPESWVEFMPPLHCGYAGIQTAP